jgi:hypothetical protein
MRFYMTLYTKKSALVLSIALLFSTPLFVRANEVAAPAAAPVASTATAATPATAPVATQAAPVVAAPATTSAAPVTTPVVQAPAASVATAATVATEAKPVEASKPAEASAPKIEQPAAPVAPAATASTAATPAAAPKVEAEGSIKSAALYIPRKAQAAASYSWEKTKNFASAVVDTNIVVRNDKNEIQYIATLNNNKAKLAVMAIAGVAVYAACCTKSCKTAKPKKQNRAEVA